MPMKPGFRLRLKASVQTLHQKLEEHSAQQELLRDDCSLAHYQRVLSAYRLAFHQLEPLLSDYTWPATSPYLSRSALLDRDLAMLGVTRVCDFSASPLLNVRNPWGCRYVVEGMSLGGQWLLRNARIFKHPVVASAREFFALKNEKWPHFCALLDQYCQSQDQQEQAIDAARLTFNVFYQSLESIDSCQFT